MRCIEGIEVVERQAEDKSGREECQLENLPPKISFEDLCIKQQTEEFQSSIGKTLGRETQENERKEKSELSVNNELIELSVKNKLSEKNEKYLVGKIRRA